MKDEAFFGQYSNFKNLFELYVHRHTKAYHGTGHRLTVNMQLMLTWCPPVFQTCNLMNFCLGLVFCFGEDRWTDRVLCLNSTVSSTSKEYCNIQRTLHFSKFHPP